MNTHRWSTTIKTWINNEPLDEDRHVIGNMSWDVSRNISTIPSRVREKVDTSVVTTISSNMRYQCMSVTMNLIKNLEQMSSGDKFDCTARGLMMISHAVPIKVMNVGLYPYEQNILPSIATALAYSPVNCNGSTPSVQILSQAMASIGIYIKEKLKRRKKNKDPFQELTESMLLSRFAMMLRCSYVCSVVGVAFTNCVPVPVDTMAKRMKCASYFSEWLGEMIMIHNSFGFKMTIMAMGAFSADTVRRCFSSYKGSAEMVNYIGVTNPAAISYMNVEKHTTTSPIPHSITTLEMYTDKIADRDPSINTGVSYEWKMYPKSVLHQFMNEKSIGALTRILVDHTVGELSDYFLNMAKNLFNNASMGLNPTTNNSALPSGVLASNIPEHAPVHSRGNSVAGPVQNQQSNQTTNQAMNAGSSMNRMPNNNTGPVYVGRNSMLAQLTDSTGKSKSQQTIIVENIIMKLNEILESYRSREKREDKIEERINLIIERGLYDDDEELEEVMNAYKKSRPEMMKEMEQAVAVAAALPTVLEGNVGVIESEIQPAAPLMRRYDGTNMKDPLYMQMQTDMNSGVAQSRNPPTSGNIFSNPNAVQDMNATSSSNTTTLAHRPGATSNESIMVRERMRKRAVDLFMDAIENIPDDGIDNMMVGLFEDNGEMLDMKEIIVTALMRYMVENEDKDPSSDSMKGLIDMMEPFDTETLTSIGRLMRNVSMDQNPNSIVQFFDNDLA